MIRPAFRPLVAAILLSAGLCQSVATAATAPAAAAAPRPDNLAAHPSFTVRVSGQGRPLILIPGLTCPGAVWDETVARYAARGYQCHVLSLAGFGGMPATPAGAAKTAATTTTAAPAGFLPPVREQLLAYIKTQRLERPAIIGHSLGGFLGLWLSVARPEVIGPLVIVDSLPFLAAVQNPALTAEAAKPMAEGMRQQMLAGLLVLSYRRNRAAYVLLPDAS